MQWLTAIGLGLNFAGTVLIAFSFGKNIGEAHQEDERGRIIYLASFLHPRWFWCGLTLLGGGFLCQFVVEAVRALGTR